MKKNLLTMLVCILLLAAVYAGYEMLAPAPAATMNVEVEIPKGATFRQAADILADRKLIRDRKVFLLMGRLTGADRKIRAGYYQILSHMSPLDIFRLLRKGQIIEYEIRVIEGDSLFEISEYFSKAGIITKDEFMKLARDREFLASYNIEAPSAEGYIFPDTYLIPKGTSAREALGIMINRLRGEYTDEMLKRMAETGMTEDEVLTLASIIEKEAVTDSERPLISAVYHNRITKHMLLQADPTSIYGVKSSKEKIVKSDLLRRTPYNTYVIKGLPPGPIASPGMKSIVAALYPAHAPYLYFVSNDDGTHKFSVTLGEHEEAVRLYRDKKKMKEEEG